MCNLGDSKWFKACWRRFTLICLSISIVCFIYGIAELVKINAYQETKCLVKDFSWNGCGKRPAKLRIMRKYCVRPSWLVEYVDYDTNLNITITGSDAWVYMDDITKSEQPGSSKTYEIGKTYACYHSHPPYHLTAVRWDKPNYSRFVKFMISGTVSLMLFICSLMIVYFYKRRSNRIRQERSYRNTSIAAIVARQTRTENNPQTEPLQEIQLEFPVENNIMETPPPPRYTPSIGVAENERIRLTPPPPYTPSMSHTEEAEENSPFTLQPRFFSSYV